MEGWNKVKAAVEAVAELKMVGGTRALALEVDEKVVALVEVDETVDVE
jgi:hypothetical protein